MEVVHLPRRGGKTTELVKWVNNGKAVTPYPYWSRVILTISIQEAMRVRALVYADYPPAHQGQHFNKVFELTEWIGRYMGSRQSEIEVAIDNADIILSHILGSYSIIKVISVSKDEV